ncbi:MAG: ATP-binding protein [Clostridiales bacterium]|nr:ATP-binding protein [Clostridiales bacterium]
MKVVVISGKGGTGKTTLTSAYAALSKSVTVKVDCDVDASNLHLMFPTKVNHTYKFSGAKVIQVDEKKCMGCKKCVEVCRFGALTFNDGLIIDDLKCEGCGACRWVCRASALSLIKEITGDIMLEEMEKGFLSRAEMISGQEGSGKLVAAVREQADDIGRMNQLLDGSPGVGCSVIASVTGTDYAVVVTEPTQSGIEDMKRVLELIKHFEVKPFVVINKYDLNHKKANDVKKLCLEKNIEVIGEIPFDGLVKDAINQGMPIIHFKESIAGQAIKKSFEILKERIGV